MINSIQDNLIKCIISKNEIIEYDKSNFKELNIDENTVLISISDTKKEELPYSIQSKFKDVLNLMFWDIEEPIGNYKPINEEQSKLLIEFIENHKKDNFVIHCKYGESRSAAVGNIVYLIIKFDKNIKEFNKWEENPINKHKRYKDWNKKIFNNVINYI